ncbi:cytochrome C [Dyella subtropica]|uniref:cytochrome C n=1 Tax=Dyella subtropica TaxID=2992127 RepID=UPI002250B7DB|nr:cytochrome C [Dyella subtropica]
MNAGNSTRHGTRTNALTVIHRLLLAMLAWLVLHPASVQAVPSFARQTKQPCATCHIGGFGPQLTLFGRQFKLLGYTMKVGDDTKIPLSLMLVESFTHTRKAQADPPAKGFSRNNNTELQQASVFLAGRISEHLGVLAQATYSDSSGRLGWDNMELRYARTFKSAGHSGLWGLSLNNNPGLSDVYNTTPAWQFPYMSPDLAPAAPAQPILFGGLAGRVVGASAYAQIDSAWYVEAGGYRSLSPAFLRHVNADFTGRLAGITPYARMAYSRNIAGGNVELGGILLSARKGLAGTNATGNAVPLAGPTDRYRDIGLDASYQHVDSSTHVFTVKALYVDEHQRLDATYAAGGAEHRHNTLRSLNINGSYWYRNTWGVTLGAFSNKGSADALLYPGTGRPDTNGGVIELNWNPFGKADSWSAPFANLRLGAQYTFYTRFGGAVHNIDGAGRRASDNNTMFVYAWLAL